MTRRINHVMFRGLVNKDARVVFTMTITDEGQYPTIQKREDDKLSLMPNFAISISEGFDKPYIFIPGNRYFQFVLLLRKTVKLVSEHMFELYPDTTSSEFEIDSRTLERFQSEKAMSTAGMTLLPDVWVNETNECFPALKIETLFGTCKIPFEDCMAIAQMFRAFDPFTFGISLIQLSMNVT